MVLGARGRERAGREVVVVNSKSRQTLRQFSLGGLRAIFLPYFTKMPILDTCCCRGSLRAGTIISGILGMIISITTLVFILVTEVKMQTIIIDTLPPNIVRIILAVNLAMTILISLLLILGAIQQNKYLLLPWVALGLMLVIGLAISVIYTSIRFYIWGDAWSGTMWLVLGLLADLIYLYLWLVVFSYYQLLREEGGHGFYAKTRY